MVAAGVTVVLPFAVTVPTLLMLTLVALLVVQLRVLEAPGAILSGLASKRTICGAPATAVPTVTVACCVTLPLAPVAVRV